MNIKDLAVVTKTAHVDFPGIPGFKLEIAAISREVSKKLKESSEITKIDPKLKMSVKEIDEDTFILKFAEAAIKGWSGLKVKHIEELMLVELNGADLDDDVPYNTENACDLLRNSPTFDSWVNEMVFDITRFRD